MSLIGFALIFTVAVALYNLQQIKMILKEKGHAVDIFSGWLVDYRKFKDLVRREAAQETKIRYQRILNGFHFSLAGLVFLIILLLKDRL